MWVMVSNIRQNDRVSSHVLQYLCLCHSFFTKQFLENFKAGAALQQHRVRKVPSVSSTRSQKCRFICGVFGTCIGEGWHSVQNQLQDLHGLLNLQGHVSVNAVIISANRRGLRTCRKWLSLHPCLKASFFLNQIISFNTHEIKEKYMNLSICCYEH